jgi:hypothetical protein
VTRIARLRRFAAVLAKVAPIMLLLALVGAVNAQSANSGCSTTQNPGDGAGTSASQHTTPLPVTNGIANGNLWNTVSSSGSIQQCYGSSGLTTRIALHSISVAKTSPAGFPEVGYGMTLIDTPFCVAGSTCHTSPFPLSLAALNQRSAAYQMSTTYRLGSASPATLPRDLSYDLWLEQRPTRNVGPGAGDIEVQILPFDEGEAACNGNSSQLRVPATIGGHATSAWWQVCQASGGSSARLVLAILERPLQVLSRSISLPIAPFADKAIAVVRGSGASVRNAYHLMGLELGGEFGGCHHPNCPTAPASWSFRIAKLALTSRSSRVQLVNSTG